MMKAWVLLARSSIALLLGIATTQGAIADELRSAVQLSKLGSCYSAPQPIALRVTNTTADTIQINVAVEARMSDGWQEVQPSLMSPSKGKLVAFKQLKSHGSIPITF